MKKQRIKWLITLLGLALLSFGLSACATGGGAGGSLSQASGPQDRMENLLVQAGFIQYPQANPNCQKLCGTLPAGQFVPYKKGDKQLYGYVNPDRKRMYAGDEAAYQRFINLAVMNQVEEKYRPVSSPRNDPEFWTMWEDAHGGG